MTLTDDRAAEMQTLIAEGWTPELFEAFWSAPDPVWLPAMVTDDVVGHWPGSPEPARGAEAYVQALVDLLAALPDLTLEVPARAVNGDVGFVRWMMHATGANGPFTMRGGGCVHTRDGLVCENFITFDSAELARHLPG